MQSSMMSPLLNGKPSYIHGISSGVQEVFSSEIIRHDFCKNTNRRHQAKKKATYYSV